MDSQPPSAREIARFQQVTQWLDANHSLAFGDELNAALESQFPKNRADRMRYLRWSTASFIEKNRAQHAPVSRQEFVKVVRTTNILWKQQPLLDVLWKRTPPFLPLGTAKGIGYCLVPSADLLEPYRTPVKPEEVTRFEQVSKWLNNNHPWAHGDEFDRVLESQIKDPQDQMRFLQWSGDRGRKRYTDQFVAVSREEFTQAVQTTDMIQYQKPLMEIMRKRAQPFLPLGAAKGIGYSLVPSADLLEPHRDAVKHATPPKYPNMNNVLGINYDVEPSLPSRTGQAGRRARRNQNMSEESANSADSDDTAEGIVFHQLGALYAFSGDWSQVKHDPDKARVGRWEDTGFVVVVECLTGHAGDVFVVFNFNPPTITDSGDVYRNLIEADDVWGFLPGSSNVQFSVARISNNFGLLEFGKEFEFRPTCFHEPELVGTYCSHLHGVIVRETVELGSQYPCKGCGSGIST